VFPDTSVLFPMSVFDLLMRMTEIGVHEILWSEDLLAELERVWEREREAGRRVPSVGAAEAALAGVRATFPDEVPPIDYRHMAEQMPGDDPDDRLHIAAAVAGGATHLLTNDGAGFPADRIAELGPIVVSADQYLAAAVEEFPDDMTAIVRAMVERRRRHEPDLDVDILLRRWHQQGLTALVRALGYLPLSQ
jgi:predicted nucleic acid-binding protein